MYQRQQRWRKRWQPHCFLLLLHGRRFSLYLQHRQCLREIRKHWPLEANTETEMQYYNFFHKSKDTAWSCKQKRCLRAPGHLCM